MYRDILKRLSDWNANNLTNVYKCAILVIELAKRLTEYKENKENEVCNRDSENIYLQMDSRR